MKRLLKILKWSGIVLISLFLLFFLYVQFSWNKKYDAPFPDIKASTDSAVIARGKYLANGPAHCGGCHTSMEDVMKFENGEPVDLKGGWELVFPGFGTFTSHNLTSDKETGLGSFTDAEIARSLRHGIGRDGRALFPMMPFQGMSDDDLTAIISYLRTLPPVKNKVKPMDYGFLYKAVMAVGLVKPEGPKSTPAKSVAIEPTVEYGKYLAYHVSNCFKCHTQINESTGEFIGKDFAGKAYFPPDAFSEGYSYMSPNLTPDKATGVMASWSEDDFIKRFKGGRVHKGSPMPWGAFSRMDTVELRAIFKYLQSLEPANNKIEKTVFAPGEKPEE
ncbi:MAG TPA: cytochrome c [Saprospiraceae bacterium]|nr:cytochrome c [Saprospiraceae bacterium]